MLHVVPALGEFVPAGAPLVRVEGPTAKARSRRGDRRVRFGLERTLDEDVAYGFRMLVDMAERSLSDSPFLDPTTAVQRSTGCTTGYANSPVESFPTAVYHDGAGQLRLRTAVMDWDAYVHLAFDEIRLAGTQSPQVTRRLVAALNDLREIAPTERVPDLGRATRPAGEGRSRAGGDERDATMALAPDAQGIGVAAGPHHSAEPS